MTRRGWAYTLLLSIAAAVLLEYMIARMGPEIIAEGGWRENAQNLYPAAECYINGYDLQDSAYIPNSDDPQIGFYLPQRDIGSVVLVFSRPVEEEIPIRVCYASAGEDLSEEGSIQTKIKRGAVHAVIWLPEGSYNQIRLDLSGSFCLSEVYTSPDRVQTKLPFRYMRLLLIWAAIAGIIIIQRKVILPNKDPIKKFTGNHWQTAGIVLMCCAEFAACLMLALHMPMDLAPDEYMRRDIPFWMYEHNALPIGNESELLSGRLFGFSYGFVATRLPSILAWLMMHVFAIFRNEGRVLALATRFPSVLACVGSTYVCYLAGRKYFKNIWSAYFFTVLVSFLPQFVFVGAYHNCDAVSVFGCCLVLYNLLSGREAHWPIKSCVGLSVGISICLLSYYNSYGWVLVSVVFCLVSCMQDTTITKKARFIGNRVLFVALIVLALSGWSFLRNAILYDGDFLGRKAMVRSTLDWEAAGHSVYWQQSVRGMGKSLWAMLTEMGWIQITIRSFFAGFGYMTIFLSNSSYLIYVCLLLIGLVGCIYSIRQKQMDALLFLTLLAAAIIPVILSLIYSYDTDYQPQGRYIMPMLPAMALIAAQGYDYFTGLLQKGRRYYIFSGTPGRIGGAPLLSVGLNASFIGCCLWLAMFVFVYFGTMVPQLCR